MKETEILNIIKNYLNIEDVSVDKIPNIDLYMDQVTTFIEDSLNEHKRDDNQKIITKTMVNNYVKDGIIPSPNKKKYNKNHLISLILIYHLKSIISINDIKLILKDRQENIEDIYNNFLKYKNNEKEKLYNYLKNLLDNIEKDEKNEIDLITFLIAIIDEANKRKFFAEKIIDLYFKD